MAIIAVAGGTGNVGRAIIGAILATGKHEVKILSRKPNPELEVEIGAPIVPVDYSDVDAVVKVLEDNNIHTVVSGLAMHSADGKPPLEIELIRAADRSKATKRFISSAWGVPVTDEHIGTVPSVIHKINAQQELQKTTNLEYTVFHTGSFMDYWGIPAVKTFLDRMPLVFWLDMANNAAALPGSGNTPAIFTHTTDVARFVAASLDLPSWEPETFVFGDRATWNEILHWAEEVKGTKFNVAYDSREKLERGEVTELPGQVPLYPFFPKPAQQAMGAGFGRWFEDGVFDMKPANGARFLNDTFPDIEPLTIKELLEKAWKRS
ncbi:isoflavone reductase [Parachaetomium inaequale]|uniref:Isoflavone reductase n=1 Tax=Parachaetomium inaequale TaxID=2588326 RepID=A0AAN6SL38_9PEZI|nr:isoflavone reductase [Parachaetomium inaequale]